MSCSRAQCSGAGQVRTRGLPEQGCIVNKTSDVHYMYLCVKQLWSEQGCMSMMPLMYATL